jgi:aminoglycoside 2'-N-acetyltransferase I
MGSNYDRLMDVLMFDEGAAPADLRSQVVALQRVMAPGLTRDITGVTHDQTLRPATMVLLIGREVVASLDVLTKEILHSGERYQASGLSWVVTDPEHRRHGYGKRLVAAARERIAASDTDVGLFTCDRQLQPFYASAGWELLPETVLVGGTPDDPFPSDQSGFDKITFGGFFTDHARAHRSDFIDARINLYSGPIDKLW